MPHDELLQQLIHNQDCFKAILWIVNEKVLALQEQVERLYDLSEKDYMKEREFLKDKSIEIQKLMDQIHTLEVIVCGERR